MAVTKVTAIAYNTWKAQVFFLVFQSLEFIELAKHFLVRMLLK
jgi:hypothetical protein